MLYYKHANKPICEQSNACTKSNSKHSRQQTTNSGPAEHMLAEQKLPKHREAITKQTTCTRFPVKYITTQKFRQISCDYHSTFFDWMCTGRTLLLSRDAEPSGRKHTSTSYLLRVHASFASSQIQRARAHHRESETYSHNYAVRARSVEQL